MYSRQQQEEEEEQRRAYLRLTQAAGGTGTMDEANRRASLGTRGLSLGDAASHNDNLAAAAAHLIA